MKLLFLVLISIQSAFAQPSLEIHKNDLWRSMIEQWLIIKSTSPELIHEKITLESPALRVDLSLQDMIDQVEHIAGNQLSIPDPIGNFDLWYSKLNELAAANPALKNDLDRKLVLQKYNVDGVALTDGIEMQRLGRIRLIEKYNKIALDPEGSAILVKLRKDKPITAVSLNQLSRNEIRNAKNSQYQIHYQEMFNLEAIDHQKYGSDAHYTPVLEMPRKVGMPLSVYMVLDETIKPNQSSRREADERFFMQIFNALEKLPEKNRFVEAIDHEMEPKLPRNKDGNPVLTPSFLQEFETKLTVIIKDLTWLKQLSQEDDETLFQFRKWIKHHREGTPDSISETLASYNQNNGTLLKLNWLANNGMPHRADVIESYEILRTIYNGTEPWQDEIDTVMRNRRGNEVIIGRTAAGSIIRRTGIIMKNAVKYENLAGAVAGGGTFVLTGANLGFAMMAQSVVHDVIANRKYDHNPRELLTQVPEDLITGFLSQSALQPGRIFNVIALGAGSGLAQGLVTKQDPFKSALVGATLETGLNFVPVQIRNPLVSGISNSALTKNAMIEVFTTSAKTTLRGGIVAVLDKKNVINGMKNGAIYGASTTALKLAFLGIQYDPLAGHTMSEIQTSIDEENLYDNTHGAPGGNYQITVKMIQDTPYRAHGILPRMIPASITLPGNVAMYPTHVSNIDVVVHESHHLSQQEQLGLISFYLQYLYESVTVPYNKLTFEISPH